MWAGAIAHNSILGRGREEDWGTHGMEHPLSAVYNIAHGAGLAILFPAWMKYVYKINIDMFVQYAVEVWGVSDSLRNREEIALKGIEETEKFFKSIGLPSRLIEIGVKESDIPDLVKKALARGPLGGFKKLDNIDTKDAEAIYKIAYK